MHYTAAPAPDTPAPTLLSALEDIRAERLEIRSGQTRHMISSAKLARVMPVPAVHKKHVDTRGNITAKRYASRYRIRNWQRACYFVSIMGTLAGFLAGWWVLGGPFPDNVAGFTTANAIGFQAPQSTPKADRLSPLEWLNEKRNCVEVVSKAATGEIRLEPCR